MATIVVDENLPRSLAPELRQLSYTVKDVREHNLRGQPDTDIYEFTQREQAILVTNDLGFANTIRFPLGSHWGIVVFRLPNELSADRRIAEIVKVLSNLKDVPLDGALVIASPGKVRIKRKE